MNINNFIKSYDDMKSDKNDILKDNKNKAGVYCLINKVNDKIYIGSSLDLRVRF
jgi:excinuclease UvrABC nuclease subunit